MAGSQSQTSTSVARGGRNTTAPPAGGVVRRRTGRSDSAKTSKKQQAMNYYTDDSPGLKISPVVVIGMSIGFIVFVTVLHIINKIRG